MKRLNNIHKENEIYARRSIKVPSKPFCAALAGIHSNGNNSPEKSEDTDNIVTKEVLTKKLSSTLLNLPSTSIETDFNKVIFNSNIISKPCDNIDNTLDETHDEEVRLLPQEFIIPEPTVSKYSCSGADADISWITLIVCIVVVIFVVPLIYILYIAEHPEAFHHEPHHS